MANNWTEQDERRLTWLLLFRRNLWTGAIGLLDWVNEQLSKLYKKRYN